MRTELFMYFFFFFVLSLYSERPLNPPVVYTTNRSKAVVPMLFLFCVDL